MKAAVDQQLRFPTTLDFVSGLWPKEIKFKTDGPDSR